jgi:8-oxo-dGTP pyrophosphatase MutT (NUDIX family)
MTKISAVTFTPIVTSIGGWTGVALAVRCAKRGNHLEFPGGKPEAEDETLYHTAARELKEETGIVYNPNLLKFLWTGKTGNLKVHPDHWYDVHCFLTPAIQADRVKKQAKEYPVEIVSMSSLYLHPEFGGWYRQFHDVLSNLRDFHF